MSQLDAEGRRLLAWLVGKHVNVDPEDQRTYPSYKDAHDELGLPMIGRTWGHSLQLQGLTSLNVWTATQQHPAITGLIIDRETLSPGGDYFESYGRSRDDFAWWMEEMRQSKTFDWSPYLLPSSS